MFATMVLPGAVMPALPSGMVTAEGRRCTGKCRAEDSLMVNRHEMRSGAGRPRRKVLLAGRGAGAATRQWQGKERQPVAPEVIH